MPHVPRTDTLKPPVAVGGIGGSGTRIVAELIRSMGVHIGTDVNAACDTLWFTLLFKRLGILSCGEDEFAMSFDALRAGLRAGQALDRATRLLLLELCRDDRPGHCAQWLAQRAQSLESTAAIPAHGRRWGWKEPNTHVVIERLWQYQPNLRYVHVTRHGVDMAFSSNQNQLALWGPSVLGDDLPATPARSLEYWCHTHRRMQRLLQNNPDRMHWLDYDALCRQPAHEAGKLAAFLDCDVQHASHVLAKVRPPAPPRHASEDLGVFSPDDLDYVRSLGYGLHTNGGPQAAHHLMREQVTQ